MMHNLEKSGGFWSDCHDKTEQNTESERPGKFFDQPGNSKFPEMPKTFADSGRPKNLGPEKSGKSDVEYGTETVELNKEQKQMLKDRLGWSDKKIDDNCRIDENGTIHYKTDCQYLEGRAADCGVPYERKAFEYNGVKMEGVFPVFESAFDTKIAEKNYQSSSSRQFSEANKNLKEAVDKNPELKEKFTPEQLGDIQNGDTPRGFTWHHNEEPGRMQLVKTEDHDKRIGGAAHTGGNSIWGNKSVERTGQEEKKGVSF